MPPVASDATATLRPPGRPATRWLILAVICVAQLTVVLDNTVLNVAVPSLTEEMGATTADVQWMINAYSLVQSGLLLTAGNSADRYGRKKMLAVGLVLFGIASLGATLAQSPGQLIAARAGMGVGGALLVTTTLAVVMQIFDDAERPKAIGIWSSVNSLGFAAGPADRRRAARPLLVGLAVPDQPARRGDRAGGRRHPRPRVQEPPRRAPGPARRAAVHDRHGRGGLRDHLRSGVRLARRSGC